MTISRLDKPEWHAYFDHISKVLAGKSAEVELGALGISRQVEGEWLPLMGISYDPKSDIIQVALEGLDHPILQPREVLMDQTADHLNSVEVIDADDYRHIIRLRDPLMLPPP
jgi:Family of unknown function (DUF5335)